MARLQFAYTPSDYFSRVVKLIGATYEVGGQQYTGDVDIVGFTAATGAVYDEPNGTQQTDLLVDGQASSTVPAASAETVAFEGPDGVEQDLWLTADSGSNWFRMIPDWSTVIAAIKTRLLPSGGTTGQVLSKKSNTSYDTEWTTAGSGTGLPSGGTTDQTLIKQSAVEGDADWETRYFVPASGSTDDALFKNSATSGDTEWAPAWKRWSGSQVAYDALGSYDNNTLYVITS